MAKDIAITTNFEGQRAERSVKNAEEKESSDSLPKVEKAANPPKTVQKEVKPTSTLPHSTSITPTSVK